MSRDPYDVCLDIARAHYENFPVASILVPRAMRRDIAAVYAFSADVLINWRSFDEVIEPRLASIGAY